MMKRIALGVACTAAMLAASQAAAAIRTFAFQIDATGFAADAPLSSVSARFVGSFDDSADRDSLLPDEVTIFAPQSRRPEFSYSRRFDVLTFGSSTNPGQARLFGNEYGFSFSLSNLPSAARPDAVPSAGSFTYTYATNRFYNTNNGASPGNVTVRLLAPGAPITPLGVGWLAGGGALVALGLMRRPLLRAG